MKPAPRAGAVAAVAVQVAHRAVVAAAVAVALRLVRGDLLVLEK